MARFRSTISGDNRDSISRLGHHGMYITADGWNIGVDILLTTDEDNNDRIIVNLTGGSNNKTIKSCIYDSTKIDNI